MILNTTADCLKNGLKAVWMKQLEDSNPFQVKDYGLMTRKEDTGDQYLLIHMIRKEMFMLETGTTILKNIVN